MKPRLFKLPNGLRVILEENHASPVISLQALVTVGSADETDAEAGMSHLMEHMLFKGTKKRKVGEIAWDVEAAGGDINAYTSFDQTVYYIHMASRFKEKGLEILADAVQNPTFDPAELEKEKEVILEEIRRERDNPSRHVGDILFRNAFQKHTYGRPIIGFDKTVKGATQEALFGFHRRWYTPENTVIVLVGDFETESMGEAVKREFSGFLNENWERPVTPRLEEPPQKGSRLLVEPDNIQTGYFACGFHIPPMTGTDLPALDLLTHILGGAQSSRLEQVLKEKKRLVQSIYAYAYAPKDPGLLLVGGHLKPVKMPATLREFWKEIVKFSLEGPTREELENAKRNIRASEIYEKETVGGQAGKLAYYMGTTGDFNFEEDYFRRVQATEADQVREVCRKYLRDENMTLAFLVPKGKEKPGLKRSLRPAMVSPAEREVKKPGAGKMAPKENIRKVTLPNGVRILLRKNRNLPLVGLCLGTPGGLIAETPADNGIHHMMAKCLTKGTRKKNALEVARSVESMAGGLDAFSGKNSYGLRMEVLSEHLERALDLFFEVLLEPAWDPREVAKEKKLTVEAIKNQEDNLSALAFHLFQKKLFASHPYGMHPLGTRQTVAGLSPARLRREHLRRLGGRETVFAIVGDFETEPVLRILREKLGTLKKTRSLLRQRPREPGPEKPRTVVTAKEKAQAHIVAGFRSGTFLSPDHYPMVVLNNILSGMGGRLFTELRDKQSLAYTVTSVLSDGLDPGFFAVYIGTDPSKVPVALKAIRIELDKIRETPVPAEELRRIQAHLVGAFELDHQKNGSVAQSLMFNELYGLGWAEYLRYTEKILKVTPAEMRKAARGIIDFNACALSVVQPAGAPVPSL